MKKYLIGALSAFFSFNIWAHPHAFVDMKNTPLVENNQLVGFAVQWVLDEPSSAAVLYDIKQAHGDKEALKTLLDEMMGNIVSEHYFSYLYDQQGNKIKYLKTPRYPGMKTANGRIMYHFDFLLAKPQALQANTFTLMTYDPTYYVSMYYDQPTQSAVDFSKLPANCKGSVIEPNVDEKMRSYAASLDKSQRDEDSSLGEIFAQKIQIQCE